MAALDSEAIVLGWITGPDRARCDCLPKGRPPQFQPVATRPRQAPQGHSKDCAQSCRVSAHWAAPSPPPRAPRRKDARRGKSGTGLRDPGQRASLSLLIPRTASSGWEQPTDPLRPVKTQRQPPRPPQRSASAQVLDTFHPACLTFRRTGCQADAPGPLSSWTRAPEAGPG